MDLRSGCALALGLTLAAACGGGLRPTSGGGQDAGQGGADAGQAGPDAGQEGTDPGQDAAVAPEGDGGELPADTGTGGACGMGTHDSFGACVPCDNTMFCGQDCAACPADPAGGAYACAGATEPSAMACTLSCAAGFMKMGDQCTACTAAGACGNDCRACPTTPNGSYTCAGNDRPAADTCTLTCDAGFTRAGNACVACNNLTACGNDCSPCPPAPAGGTYSCQGNMRPAGDSCSLACSTPGMRPAGGDCVPCDTTMECGNDCRPCPTNPANGSFACGGSGQPAAMSCTLSCAPGSLPSGTTCVACNTPAACGNDCLPCPPNPMTGMYVCSGNGQPAAMSCSLGCGTGFRDLGNGTCLPCNTATACGSDCGACPANGSCTSNTQPAAQACLAACPSGQRRVNGACTACSQMSICLGDCPGTCTSDLMAGCAGEPDPPNRLECTFFYESQAALVAGTESPDVYPFDPGFHLWSDGAEKSRWIYLPPGQRIDTADMDEWIFPAGTRVFKEFRKGSDAGGPAVRVETRMLYKLPNGLWSRTVYVWTPAGAIRYGGAVGLVTAANVRPAFDCNGAPDCPTADPGAIRVDGPGGIPNANLGGLTTTYEVPPDAVCANCHQGRIDNLLGVEAIGLSTTESSQCDNATPGNPCLTLREATRNGLLTAPPVRSLAVPGNATERAALGFLHMNCGTCCHNPSGFAQANFTGFFMRLETNQLSNPVNMQNTYTTGVRVLSMWQPDGATGRFRITPQAADMSVVIYRMSRRNTRRPSDFDLEQMPPIATHVAPAEGLTAVRAWMNALP